jgi:hypothetical protein
MVQLTQAPIKSKERHRKAVMEELAAFEKRENEFLAKERRERAIRLGLPYLAAAPRQSRPPSRDRTHV